jgi:uroporphyrinogen-III synthase
VIFPCIEGQSIRDEATASKLIATLGEAEWLVVSSVRGVHGVAALAGPRAVANISIAAVGKTTAAAAERALGHVDLVAEGGTVRTLAERLAECFTNEVSRSVRVVTAGAEKPNRDLDEVLEPLGIEVAHIAVYRTLVARTEEPREDIANMNVDAIFLASPSAVVGLLARVHVPKNVQIITIGPSTTRAAQEAGLCVDGEATVRDLKGMIEAIP